MQKMSKAVVAAGILGIIGVMIGAYAAHGLEAYLQKQSIGAEDIAKRIDQCDVAVRYHMLHTLAILVLGLSSATNRSRLGTAAMIFWFLGILLFCGGLYSMVFLGKMGHWAIVPSGGLCFILGWFGLVLVGATLKSTSASSRR
jgi:uncharacterized membrane protein YgdD (TMEM256/DUF423 family)